MNKDNAKDYLPLVRALADGRVIQYKYQKSDKSYAWIDLESAIDFCMPAEFYRIKLEPREIWVNEWVNNGCVVFNSEDEALAHAKRYGIGHVTKLYREVIE